MAKNINIGGRLHSIATGNVIAGADEILDDNLGKKQTQINTETYSLVESVNNALDALNPDQQEALGVAAKANANEAKLGYYVCDTAAATATKTISAIGYVLTNGGSMKIKMTNANTADNATLNINSTGAKALYYAGKRASATNSWEAGETVEVYYDGTSYYANNVAGGSSDGVFDISAAHSGATYDNFAAALGTNGDNVPVSKRKGGMSVKFIQNIYATYSVVKTEGLDTEPTGTELQSASAVVSGIYKASQLSDFSNIPVNIGNANSITYYVAVTETVDEIEVTTYTTWVITKITDDSQKYVQYRLIATSWSIVINDWQGVDDEPIYDSNNLVDSKGVYKVLYGEQKTDVNYAASNGQIIYSDGHLSTNVGYTASKYVQIENNNYYKIKYKGGEKENTIAAIAFYSTAFIDTSSYLKDYSICFKERFVVEEYEVIIPPEAKLIVVSYCTAYDYSLTLFETPGMSVAKGLKIDDYNNRFEAHNIQDALENILDKAEKYQKISVLTTEFVNPIPVQKGDILIRFSPNNNYYSNWYRQVDENNNVIKDLPYKIYNAVKSNHYNIVCNITDDTIKYVNFPNLRSTSSFEAGYILRKVSFANSDTYTEFDSVDSLNVSRDNRTVTFSGEIKSSDGHYIHARIKNDDYSSIRVVLTPGENFSGMAIAFYSGEPSTSTIMLPESKMAYENYTVFDNYYEYIAKIPKNCEYILVAYRANLAALELYKNGYIYPSKNDITETFDNYYDDLAKRIRFQHNSPSYQRNASDMFASVDIKFLFWTDLHSYYTNLNHIVNLANHLKSKDALDLMISAGDNLERGDEDPETLNKYLSACLVDTLVSEGNHERAAYHHGDAELAYNICIAPTLARVENVVAPEDSASNYRPYYYKDYNSVRIVILYTTYDQTEQLSWLTDVLTDAKTNSKHVILVNHPPHDNNYATMIYSTPQAYADAHVNTFHSAQGTLWGGTPFGGDTDIPAAYLLAVKSFEDAGGNFICWLTGHTHQDCFYDVTDHDTYGYQQMFNSASCAHKHSWHDLYKEANTKSWDCINYITVDTTKKMLNIMRVGADVDTLGRGRHLLTYNYETHTIISNY